MNLREGTRRLALLLGVAGAIVGGFASYLELQAVLSQKARHNRFEQLANLDDVQKERKCRLLDYDSGCFRMKLPPGATLVEQAPNDWQDVPSRPPAKVYLDDNGNPISPAPSSVTPTAKAMHRPPKPKTQAVPGFGPAEDAAPAEKQDDPFAAIATPLASEVNTEEIKTINWSRDYGVDSIETQDGQTLYPTPAPSAWQYLLIALLPVVGFVIPWGAIRAIGWVGAGFIQSSK